MTTQQPIGFQIPTILLPRPGVDLHKWAVIACDQFTSEPEYWREVEALVGDAPSTYHMILPEIYLGTEEEARRGRSIQETMRAYLDQGLFVEHEKPDPGRANGRRSNALLGSCWRSTWNTTTTTKAPQPHPRLRRDDPGAHPSARAHSGGRGAGSAAHRGVD